jgi:hypothetical protein
MSSGREHDCCSNYLVASYTPTLKALLSARSSFKPVRREEVKVLLAAVPVPFQGRPIPAVVEEVRAVRRVIPPSLIVPIPSEADCYLSEDAGLTVSMVLDNLPAATVLHLASHGTQVSGCLHFVGRC